MLEGRDTDIEQTKLNLSEGKADDGEMFNCN